MQANYEMIMRLHLALATVSDPRAIALIKRTLQRDAAALLNMSYSGVRS